MKFLKIVLLIIIPLLISSCTSSVLKNNNNSNDSASNIQSKLPAQIAVNQSIVTAKVEQININSKYDFAINAKILKVENDPSYLSIAAVGDNYKLSPNFQTDSHGNFLDTKGNKELKDLSELNVGDTLKTVIFYDQSKGWLIEKVLWNKVK